MSLRRSIRRLVGPRPLDWNRGAGRPARERPHAVDVIVPIHGAAALLGTCLESVAAETDLTTHRVVLVVDGPQERAVDVVVEDFVAALPDTVRLLRNDQRMGFVASVNRGISSSSSDVVLLNSDTIVARRWLENLIDAAYSAGDVGTVTPLSNHATLCSVPRAFEENLLPSGFDVMSFAALVADCSARSYPRIPTGVGVCLYIRRALLDDIGLFDVAHFGLGYGEENDFCLRALAHGWLHVADDVTFIYHAGQASFGESRLKLQRRARATLQRLHPRYMATIAEVIARDPLAGVRARINAALAGVPLGRKGGRGPFHSIRTVASVIRGEGLSSAFVRAGERIAEASRGAALRARDAFVDAEGAAILNVSATGLSARLGGVQMQLVARLRAESRLRSVALLAPGVLELSAPVRVARRITADFEAAIRRALAITGATTLHLEGTDGVPRMVALRLLDEGVRVVVSVHDFSLFCARPHLLELPMGRFCAYSEDFDRCHRCLRETFDVAYTAQAEYRALGRRLLASATGLIFPSRFLLERHRALFALPDLAGEIIEPGVPSFSSAREGARPSVAYAGSVKRHKGAHLLPEIIRLTGDADWHVFGGGDEGLLRALRRLPNVTVHGYYRNGRLPSLLTRHRVGLVVLPSIVPEAHGLVLSEAWRGGAMAVAFDLGALAERIRRDGGGWLAPLDRGAAGLAQIVGQWRSGQISSPSLNIANSPIVAARAMVDRYRTWELL